MLITALSITPPKGAEHNPKVTPELQASVLARYSRSNDGLANILSKVDLNNPEESIARILKFADYGHASIGGLTGGLAVAIDGLTMFAAYKLFELAQMADGQESSTRYISMDESGLPNWVGLGFSDEEAAKLQAWALHGIACYKKAYAALDEDAKLHPEIVRIPEKLQSKPAAVTRLQKNYALDRARYYLPFAMKTNAALVMTARMWAEVISALLSSGVPELMVLGEGIKEKLMPYASNLLRHARAKKGWASHSKDENAASVKNYMHGTVPCFARINISTEFSDKEIAQALANRENRYDRCGVAARDTHIRVTWQAMAIAELRDLNRHRTGSRFTALRPVGFYVPEEAREKLSEEDLKLWENLTFEVLAIAELKPLLRAYCLALGMQVSFRHSQPFDKFVYEAELRTGAGAHYRYAKHLNDAVNEVKTDYPLTAAAIQTGEAEPE